MYRGKKAGMIALTAVVLAAAVLGGGAYVRQKYTVRQVYVEGNVHYTEEEIKAIVMDGKLGDNSMFLSLKYKNKGIHDIPFVDVMDVEVLAPDTIRIVVYEKILTGYVKYLNTYMYFDKDGCVVESSSIKTAGVPQVTGLKFDHIVVGEVLPVENQDVFYKILNVTKLLNKYNLNSDKLYFNNWNEVTVYFGNVKVTLGNDAATLEDKIMLLPELLPNLEGKSGTLQMVTYDDSGGRYTFKTE